MLYHRLHIKKLWTHIWNVSTTLCLLQSCWVLFTWYHAVSVLELNKTVWQESVLKENVWQEFNVTDSHKSCAVSSLMACADLWDVHAVCIRKVPSTISYCPCYMDSDHILTLSSSADVHVVVLPSDINWDPDQWEVHLCLV